MSGFLSSETISISLIEQACQKRRELGLPLLDLTSSNPTLNGYLFPTEVLFRAAEEYLKNRKYEPDCKGLLAAREAISSYYKNRFPTIDIPVEQIFITASTSESYSLLFSLLSEPGDNFLAPNITYPLFDFLAEHHRLKLKTYSLSEKHRWSIDQQSVRQARTTSTKGILIVSPHNPTGSVCSEHLEALEELNLAVISDEVFSEYNFQIPKVPALGVLYPNLPVFHLNGISKMFALPDLKLGWIALNHSAYEIYGERLEILNDTFLSANSFIQSALPRIFKDGQKFAEKMYCSINQKLSYAINKLKQSSAIEVVEPDGGYYLFPKIHTDLSEEELVLRLIEKGVLFHPGSLYGATTSSHLMFSCLVSQDDLEQGIQLLLSEI